MLGARVTDEGDVKVSFTFSGIQKAISSALVGGFAALILWTGTMFGEFADAVERSKINTEVSTDNANRHMKARDVRAALLANDAALRCEISRRHNEPCEFLITNPLERD